MTEKQRYSGQLPTMGDRSASFFGISRLFHPNFFHNNSSGYANRTSHPCLKFLRGDFEREQTHMKQELIETLSQKGYSHADALGEWKSIVKDTTAIATQFFNRLCSGGVSDVVNYDDDKISDVKRAGREGIEFMRQRLKTFKDAPPKQMDLFLSDERVYLRAYPQYSDGTRKIKIGKTTNFSKRDSSYENHTGGELASIWETRASYVLNEDAFRDALRSASGIGATQFGNSMDWFIVSPSIYEQIKTAFLAEQFVSNRLSQAA